MTNEPNREPEGEAVQVTQELLPCPFCGSPAELDDLGDPQDDSMVSCTNQLRCGMQQIARFNPQSAAAAWNTRPADDAAVREALDMLKQYADYIGTVHSSELNRHPYLPALQDVIAALSPEEGK